MSYLLKPVAATGLFVVLAACGGGGSGDDPAGPLVIDGDVARILADGTPIDAADFAGVGFPIYFIDADTESGAELKRGTGSASFDATGDVLTVVIDTEGTFVFERVADTDDFLLKDTTFAFNIDNLGATKTFFLNDADRFGVNAFAGGFGFETPESAYPGGPVTYDSDTFGRAYLAETGGDGFVELLGLQSSTNLDVNFDTSSVTGTLFAGQAFVEIDSDDISDDLLTVTLSIENGSVGASGFSGTVAGDFFVDANDSGIEQSLPVALSNTDVDGVFFGNAAERIAATFGGNYSVELEDETSVGEFVGYIDAARD